MTKTHYYIMIKKISITKYRKLEKLEIDFSKGINIISGANGTCKTSVLHLISNSFQKVNKKMNVVSDDNSINQLIQLNDNPNQKIEKLSRGDVIYNDPAYGVQGTLYTVNYTNGRSIDFRRHNSKENSRYSLKPKYNEKGQSLPAIPVIYLGLSRLYPVGEFYSDDDVRTIRSKLPIKYVEEIKKHYKDLTGINIEFEKYVYLGDVRKKMIFKSAVSGVDSNTISSGEDNVLSILVALSTLKYYSDTLNTKRDVSSILIVDEIDATLHPSLQYELLNLLYTYSENFNIQMFFTTHSVSLLRHAEDKKCNIIYLLENHAISIMEDTSVNKIQLYLNNISKSEFEKTVKIPVFTEDNEAILLFERLLKYFDKIDKETDFETIREKLHFVDARIGCDSLKTIFADNYIAETNMRSLCIVDGDATLEKGKHKSIIKLPGNASPENLLFEYLKDICNVDKNSSSECDKHLIDFWMFKPAIDEAYTIKYVETNILIDVLNAEEDRSEKNRSYNKKIFKRHKKFFTILFDYWLQSPDNQKSVQLFYKSLHNQFAKVSRLNGAYYDLWKKEYDFHC